MQKIVDVYALYVRTPMHMYSIAIIRLDTDLPLPFHLKGKEGTDRVTK